MSTTTRDDRLSQIRKLFTLAQDPAATEGERDNAHTAIARLMARWEFTEAELRGIARENAVKLFPEYA